MGPADWFALVLRSFGIWELIEGINYMVMAISTASQVSGYNTKLMTPEITGGVTALVIGAVLIKAAPAIARRILPAGQSGSQKPTVAAMGPRDWFTVALRLFGIYQATVAVAYALYAFNSVAGVYGPGHEGMGLAVTHLVTNVALAAWLLKGAPGIARYFYPSRPST